MIVETVDFYNGLIIYNVSAVEDISTWCVCESLQMRLLQESPDECSATKSELHTPWPAATDYLTQVSREEVCNGCWVRAGAFELWTLCPTDFDFPEGGFS